MWGKIVVKRWYLLLCDKKLICNTLRESLVYQLIFIITKYCDTTLCSIKCWSLLKRNRLDRNQPTWTYLTLQCIGVRSAICLMSFQLLHIMTAPKLGMKQILIVMLAILFGSFLWKFNTKYWQLRLRYIFAHGHNLVSCRAKISQGLGVCHLSWTGSIPLLCILLVRSHVFTSNFSRTQVRS